jgi:hypothetical protein
MECFACLDTDCVKLGKFIEEGLTIQRGYAFLLLDFL